MPFHATTHFVNITGSNGEVVMDWMGASDWKWKGERYKEPTVQKKFSRSTDFDAGRGVLSHLAARKETAGFSRVQSQRGFARLFFSLDAFIVGGF